MAVSKISRDDLAVYVKAILDVYYRATTAQLAQGRTWYNTVQDIARVIGNGNVRLGAGLIAALSPNTLWSLNLTLARKCANGEPFGTLPGNIANAMRILAGEDFASVLPAGKKTWHFAHNIAGDASHVTIDRWAIRIAVGTDKKSVTPLQYAILADAYAEAANVAGETPAAMQAITWCVIRGNGD